MKFNPCDRSSFSQSIKPKMKSERVRYHTAWKVILTALLRKAVKITYSQGWYEK